MTLVLACTGPTDAGDYFLHASSQWALVEAVDPKTPAAGAERSLDWYAEYQHGRDEVRLSGHSVELGQLEADLDGFEFERAEVREAPGVIGRGADGPNVAAFEAGPSYAVMALSYSLDRSHLTIWMEGLEEATQEQWVQVGGRIES